MLPRLEGGLDHGRFDVILRLVKTWLGKPPQKGCFLVGVNENQLRARKDYCVFTIIDLCYKIQKHETFHTLSHHV